MTALRIATFNLENFDEIDAGERPSLDERIALMRPQVIRLRADILCFQEVKGQERPNQPRALLALQRLLKDADLDGAAMVSTKSQDNDVFDERNLVVASHHALHVMAITQAAFTSRWYPAPQQLTATGRGHGRLPSSSADRFSWSTTHLDGARHSG